MKELEEVLKKYTVLLAEDDDEVRKRLKNTLAFYFKDVYEENNGNDAYDVFIEKKPDLLISDIEMRDGDGIELVKRIRKVNLHTPIIILSAYSKEEYLLKLINLKIDYYLLKPTTNKQLFDAISKALVKINNNILQLTAGIRLNIDDNTILYNGEKIVLRKKEKDFLELLFQNKNRITKYDLIQEYIWGDKIMTQNALKTFIKELRQKMPVDILKNIKQEGYIISQ
ncbi:MAG: response regulator [Sulfurospirillaceae bacterium]|nr:response regulator [Sulfurospirillaceae bacterium]